MAYFYTAFILSHISVARETCESQTDFVVPWRVSLAVCGHESGWGGSRLATEAMNFHGLTKRYGQGYRIYDNEEDSWKEFAKILASEGCYEHVRKRVYSLRSEGASEKEIEESFIREMGPMYVTGRLRSSPVSNHWVKDTLGCLEMIRRIEKEKVK